MALGYLNCYMLMGRLTASPDFLEVGAVSICRFTVAMNRRYTKKDGSQAVETNYIECEAARDLAIECAKTLTKGTAVFIEGRLVLEQWTDKKSRAKRQKHKVVMKSMSVLDKE